MRQIILVLSALVLCTGQVCAPTDGANLIPGTTETNGDGTAGSGTSGNTQPDNSTPGPGTGGTDPGTGSTGSSAIVADHLAPTAFESIPDATIDAVQSNYRIWYGHTSHGSQIVTGMGMIYSVDARFAFNDGAGSLSLTDDGGVDLGGGGDLSWVDTTRDILNQPGNDINVIVWSWCGGVSENTEEGINAYLNAMNQLEADYPAVRFVYMTGHLDGRGPAENLYARNNQIRNYCRANNKVLFDFADIESYDPAGNYYPDGSDWCEWCTDWAATHSCPPCEDCAHSQCYNCYVKGRAFWWLLARLTGWSGT